MASAAEAPQIATAPPVSKPKLRVRPALRASTMPHRIVSNTALAASTSAAPPRDWIWSNVMRAPSSATPRRRIERDAKSIPGLQRSSWERKLTAMPSSSANSMTGVE